MKHSVIFLGAILFVYIGFVVIFNFFPRSTYSKLEKRELATFPAPSLEAITKGKYTDSVSSWYSDSEPFRDVFMLFNTKINDLKRISTGKDNITFHAAANNPEAEGHDDSGQQDSDEYVNEFTADENAKISNSGIIVVGEGENVRALMAFGGGPKSGTEYARAANVYKEAFGNAVNVYCMVVPTAISYYCPEKAKSFSHPEKPTIDNIYAHLAADVKPVDIYPVLGKHAAEDIYLRTDHHWAPLGAYYAAQKFAEVAKVPFRDLANYEKVVVHGYVGSMYGYSGDIAVKNAPEDFVYYVPKDIRYTTTYITYSIDAHYRVTAESKPHQGKYFYYYKNGNAYCNFMGGDTKITQVRTATKNGRRLLVIKDSFGNALPGYLFYSFEEIHVVDGRYFKKNLKDYVAENKITDILFCNNSFKACSRHIGNNYIHFLSQQAGVFHKPAPKSKADTVAEPSKVPVATEPAPPPDMDNAVPVPDSAHEHEQPATSAVETD